MLAMFRTLMGLPNIPERQPPVEGQPVPDEAQVEPIDSTAEQQPQPTQE